MPFLTYSPYIRVPRAPSRGQFYLPPLNWQIDVSESRGRFAYHEARAERRRRLHLYTFHTLNQESSGQSALLDDRLTHRRQWRIGTGRRRHVVEPDHRQILWYPEARGLGGRHDADGGHVAHGEHGRRPALALGQGLERPRACGDRDARHRGHRFWGARRIQRFTVTVEPPGRGGRAVDLGAGRWQDEDCEMPVPELQEVPSRRLGATFVVDVDRGMGRRGVGIH